MLIHDMHAVERPREKLERSNPEALSDAELLALVLRTGYAGRGVTDLAGDLLKAFPEGIGRAGFSALKRFKGMGQSRAAAVVACFELARRHSGSADARPVLDSAQRVAQHIPAEVRTGRKEHFVAFYLNARSQLLRFETVSIGTLSASLVHPREVFGPAISSSAAALVVAHNLCDASHKLCYVERPLMLSNRSESLLDRRNIERSVDGRDVLAAHKQVCSVA